MGSLRAIDASAVAAVLPPEILGAAPQLEWLPIDRLVVDSAYQREVRGDGKRNIRRIAASFNWAFFAPVIVAPVEGGKFAIIDGQHRTTAAKLIGVERVPCSIVRADPREQAAAFDAVNGQTTAVGHLERFRAQLAAGDESARRIDAAMQRAGVAFRYCRNVAIGDFKFNETIALASIRRAIEKFGDDAAVAALSAILISADRSPGYLRAAIITAVAEVLGDHAEWREPAMLRAFAHLDIEEQWRRAYAEAKLKRGVSGNDLLQAAIVAHLEKTGRRGR